MTRICKFLQWKLLVLDDGLTPDRISLGWFFLDFYKLLIFKSLNRHLNG